MRLFRRTSRWLETSSLNYQSQLSSLFFQAFSLFNDYILAKDKVSAPTAKEIMPKEVKDLVNAELQSDLVAPIPGKKPLVAKYTLRVKPKLVNGVPQMQEIRIMPPNKSGVSAYVKPLMVLKQNITKPMIENIEIDVPKKGAKFSRKPSVEVIEGDRKETLQVHKGQAVVDDAMQRSNTKSEGMLQ